MLFKVFHSVLLILFAVAAVFALTKVSKGRHAADNAWMLPFAYFSLTAWTLWILQYGILIAGPFGLFANDLSHTASLWPAIMQNAFWIVAILSLHSKHFSRVWPSLAVLALISIVVALVIFQTPILTSDPFTSSIGAVSVATIFTVLAASLWPLRVSKLYPVVFGLHGFSQASWQYLFSSPSISIQRSLFYFSLWHVVLMLTWIGLISEMLVRFRVMISSTIKDLGPERAAAQRAIRSLDLKGWRSETIGSRPYTPIALCQLWAEQCNVFVLIIGERYGHEIKSMGKSVVEFEYEVAYRQNHGKILVYVKDGVTREVKLDEFLERLQNFEHGRVTASFSTADGLYQRIRDDLADWLASHPQAAARRAGTYQN